METTFVKVIATQEFYELETELLEEFILKMDWFFTQTKLCFIQKSKWKRNLKLKQVVAKLIQKKLMGLLSG